MTLLAPQQAYMLLGLFYVAATKQEQPLFRKISKEYLVITKTKQNKTYFRLSSLSALLISQVPPCSSWAVAPFAQLLIIQLTIVMEEFVPSPGRLGLLGSYPCAGRGLGLIKTCTTRWYPTVCFARKSRSLIEEIRWPLLLQANISSWKIKNIQSIRNNGKLSCIHGF